MTIDTFFKRGHVIYKKKERKEKSGSQTTVKAITSYYLMGSSSSFD
jgi:hypothetical protein